MGHETKDKFVIKASKKGDIKDYKFRVNDIYNNDITVAVVEVVNRDLAVKKLQAYMDLGIKLEALKETMRELSDCEDRNTGDDLKNQRQQRECIEAQKETSCEWLKRNLKTMKKKGGCLWVKYQDRHFHFFDDYIAYSETKSGKILG